MTAPREGKPKAAAAGEQQADVLELRRTVAALAVANELLERTSAMAKVGGWDLDLATNMLALSPEALWIVEVDARAGLALEQALDMIDFDDRPGLQEVMQAAITNATPWDLEVGLTTAKGRHIWVRSQGAASMEDGKVVGLHGVFQDVTERRQAAEALRVSEANLAAAQRLAHLGSWTWDLTANKVIWSDEMYRLFGVSREAFDGTPEAVLRIVHPDDREAFVAAMQESLLHGVAVPLEYRVRHPDGSERILSAAGEIVRDAAGRPVSNRGTVQDITDDRLAQEAAARSLASLRATLESVSDGILTVGLHQEIESFNGRFVEMWRIPAEVLAGGDDRRALEFVLDQLETPEQFLESVHHLYSHPLEGTSDVLRFKDGRLMERSSRPMLVGQRPVGRVWGFRDITEREQVRGALLATLREKDALLKEVHHRVKNNLQVIASLLRLAAGRLAQPQSAAIFADMQGRIRSMALLHEMLYRSGSFAAVDLGDYLRQLATESFRALNASPGAIELRFDLAALRVPMDQAMPCGLLVNELLANSLEHGFPGGRGGEVRLELQPVEGGPLWRLLVSDSGVGLPADFAAQPAGTLGMQLVSDLAGQLGGALEIGPGPGAVFSVTFPVTIA